MPIAIPRIATLLTAFLISAAAPMSAQSPSSSQDLPATLARDSAHNGEATVQRADVGAITAKVLHSVPLQLSDEARTAKFSGSILVHLTVDADGLPQDVHVVRSVGMGMDEKAIEAAQQFRFQPATEDGKPVASGMNLELKIGGGDKLTVLHSVPLEPTDEARQNHLSGVIRLALTIDENGNPQNVRVVQGLGMGMDERAVAALKQYKFEPLLKDGQPVSRTLTLQLAVDATQ